MIAPLLKDVNIRSNKVHGNIFSIAIISGKGCRPRVSGAELLCMLVGREPSPAL